MGHRHSLLSSRGFFLTELSPVAEDVLEIVGDTDPCIIGPASGLRLLFIL